MLSEREITYVTAPNPSGVQLNHAAFKFLHVPMNFVTYSPARATRVFSARARAGLTYSLHMPSTFEYSSFTAMAEQRPKYQPRCAGGSAAVQPPWLPNGPSKQHQRSKGLPSRQEVEAVGQERVRHAAENEVVSERLSAAESAMQRLEVRLDGLVTCFEAHVVSATAAQVLIAKRLAALGVH